MYRSISSLCCKQSHARVADGAPALACMLPLQNCCMQPPCCMGRIHTVPHILCYNRGCSFTVLLLLLLAGLYNCLGNCHWSRTACAAVAIIQGGCAAEHMVLQWLLSTRWRCSRLREKTKAWFLLGDIVACMFIMMLVRWAPLASGILPC